MACSDNTVRAGLTPKLKDVPTLCRLLSYTCDPASSKYFMGTSDDQFTTVFRPPVPDFAVIKIIVSEILKPNYFTIIDPSMVNLTVKKTSEVDQI